MYNASFELISGDDVCCSVVFGTLVGVFVFSVMWSELLVTSAISCPMWSSVYECQRVECAFTSPVRNEWGMFLMSVCMLYICVSCFVVRGCAVSRRYINVCNCNMFSVVNVYLDHLKFCVLLVEGMSVVVNVMYSLMSVMSSPPALCNLLARTLVKLCTLGAFALGVSLVS